MGLSNNLNDASSDSIPILFLLSAASFLSHLRSVLLCLLHSVGLPSHQPPSDLPPPPLFQAVGSRIASLALLADYLSSNHAITLLQDADDVQPPPHEDEDDEDENENEKNKEEEEECIFCLSRLEKGDQIRRLPCCHVFHSHCLDGWLHRMNLTCPLCRSPLVPERPDLDRRIGAELVAWLSPY